MKLIVITIAAFGFLGILRSNGITTSVPMLDSAVATFVEIVVG